jgi:hypothetical protein
MWRFSQSLRTLAFLATLLAVSLGVDLTTAGEFPSTSFVARQVAARMPSLRPRACVEGCGWLRAPHRRSKRETRHAVVGEAGEAGRPRRLIALSPSVPVGLAPRHAPAAGAPDAPAAAAGGDRAGPIVAATGPAPLPSPPSSPSLPPNAPGTEAPAPPAAKPEPSRPTPPTTTPPPETSKPQPEPPAPEPESPAPEPEPPAPSEEPPAPPVGPGLDSLVVAIDGGYADWSSSEIAERKALGAAVTRHEWDTSRPVDDQDSLVLTAATEVHTRIHALLGENELGDATHYREWVVAFIRRYGVGGSFWKEHPALDESRYAIRTFELGNEPYFGGMTAAEYADAVRPTLEEVKRLGLRAKIVLDSRVYGGDTSWMDTLYQRIPNLNSLFYAFADHPYWYGHDPAEVSPAGPFGRIEELRERMDEQGAAAKPILITEYGESTANCGAECVDEATQSEHLAEMIAAIVAHPEWKVEMLSVYQLVDRGTNSEERELQFGLLRENGTPKPAYAIVQAAMQSYRG